jgi:hypothetical protein
MYSLRFSWRGSHIQLTLAFYNILIDAITDAVNSPIALTDAQAKQKTLNSSLPKKKPGITHFSPDPMPNGPIITAENFDQSDITPVQGNSLRRVAPVPQPQSWLEYGVEYLCEQAAQLIPFVPHRASVKLCHEAVNLGVRNPRKIAEYAAKAYKAGKSMVSKVSKKVKGSPKSGLAKVTVKSVSRANARARDVPSSGIVSDYAPVSVGNTLTGVQTRASKISRGHRVTGREFLTTAYGTGPVNTWTMAAGIPLTPVAFVDSMLRMYGSMYSYFRWNKLTVHYVTTSSTAATGSVMFYYSKDRSSVYLNQTSPNVLPFVLSDPHTTVSPQWENFSVQLECSKELKRTDYGMSDDSAHYSAGEIFLLSRTTTTDSPGMLLLDYEIDFVEENLTPRLLLWPQPTIAYEPYAFAASTTTAGNSVLLQLVGSGGTGNPFNTGNTNALIAGAIYKVILDYTNTVNSAVGNLALTPAATPTNQWRVPLGSGYSVLTLQDGTTLYAVNTANGVLFYGNVVDAYTSFNPIVSHTSFSAASGSYLMWFSLVGFLGNNTVNPNM